MNNLKSGISRWQFAISTVAFLCAVQSFAQEEPFDFEVTPFGAYRFGGEFAETIGGTTIDLDDNNSFGLILNAKHSPITQWELLYSHQETDADTLGLGITDPVLDLDIDYLHAGGTYLWDGDPVRPFLSATVGVTQIDVSNPGYHSDSFFSFSIGLGVQIRPTDKLGLRLEARSFGTLLDSDTALFCQTGPTNNICAVRIDGTTMWQFEALAGIVFRF